MTSACFLSQSIARQNAAVAQAAQVATGGDINLACSPSDAWSRFYLYDSFTKMGVLQFFVPNPEDPDTIQLAEGVSLSGPNNNWIIDPFGNASGFVLGGYKLSDQVSIYNPATGGTVTGADAGAIPQDELLEIEPAGTLAALTVNLEGNDVNAVGNIKRMAFSQIITVLTINASGSGGGTIKGAAKTAAAVNDVAIYQKIGIKTWRRLQ